MSTLLFTIEGEPQRKERPRVARGRAFTPKATRDAEAAVVAQFSEQFPDHTPFTGDLIVRCTFYRRTRHWVDVDNLLKLVTDALNKVAYVDDKQISELTGIRVMGAGDKARTVVRIYEKKETY